MLKVKKEYENTKLSFRVGVVTVEIDVNNITDDKIKAFKNHIDLAHYVEDIQEEVIVPVELLDIQNEEEIVEVKIKKPRKKAKK